MTQRYLAALILGCLMTLGFAPFGYWFLIPAILIGFIGLLNLSEKPALTGFWFGIGWFGAGVSWVHVSIADYGGFGLPVAIFLTLLLAMYLAVYPMLFAWLFKRSSSYSSWAIAPLIWCACEALRGVLFTGFPWLSVGYSQINGPFASWLPVIGEFGLSALLIGLAAISATWLMHRRYIPIAGLWCTALVISLLLSFVNWRSTVLGETNVTLVQGNIPQSVRWQPEAEAGTMQSYLDLTRSHWQSDIIVWPEAAIPAIEPRKVTQNYLTALDAEAAANQTAVITGILNTDYPEAFNAVIVVGAVNDSDSPSYKYNHGNRYYKHHLLPIGEFVPFEDWLRSLGGIFDLPWSSFTRGDYLQPNLLAKGYKLAPALCFEILFSEQVRDNLHDDTDFILTVSNDAWFGRWHGPHQHMEIARVRAAEMGLPLIRATNTGVTALVDDSGEFLASLPQFEANTVTANVPHIRSATPYRAWGNGPVWLVLICISIVAVGLRLILRRA